MMAYEFYLCNREGVCHLIEILHERRKKQREGHRNLSRIGGGVSGALNFLGLIIKFKIEGRCRL